jgi:hypothetical protein
VTAVNDSPDAPDPAGKLVENLMLFARTLRAAGLRVGPGHVLDGIEALRTVGVSRRDDLYWTLHAVFVHRREDRPLFDQAFHVFWRNPRLLDRLMGLALPEVQSDRPDQPKQDLARRLAEALQADAGTEEAPAETQLELDAALTWSDQDTLRNKDFEQMSREEVEAAKRAIARLALPLNEQRTRRHRASARPGKADLRRTMRAGLRGGRDTIPLRYKQPRTRTPPLVVICDISGSMAQYSRLFLHFMHALTGDRERVHSFVFGTRLTNITRYLRDNDVDQALAKVGGTVTDWEGGTRIGACLHAFNRDWSRRVLGQGATVLLISDGLDRDNAEGLARQMERLHKSSRRLIWLNPLLRYAGYAPKSQGARVMIRHVDAFRSIHNLASLEDLAAVLSRPLARYDIGTRQDKGVRSWQEMTTG